MENKEMYRFTMFSVNKKLSICRYVCKNFWTAGGDPQIALNEFVLWKSQTIINRLFFCWIKDHLFMRTSTIIVTWQCIGTLEVQIDPKRPKRGPIRSYWALEAPIRHKEPNLAKEAPFALRNHVSHFKIDESLYFPLKMNIWTTMQEGI